MAEGTRLESVRTLTRTAGSNPALSANQNLNRIRKCLVWVFLLQKFRFYLRFSFVGVPSFQSFRGSYGCVRIALSVTVADGFMPRKVLDMRKECVRLSCQRQTKSPLGAVGWRFICLPTRSAEAQVKNAVE